MSCTDIEEEAGYVSLYLPPVRCLTFELGLMPTRTKTTVQVKGRFQ